MSKLDELLRELCPDGVEYKKLGEIATISRGGNFQKKDFLTEGVPCIHYGQIYTKYGLFTDKTFTFISEECAKKQKMAQPNDIVMAVTSENIEDVCKCLAWLGDEPVAVSGHSAIIHHNQNAKYLVYYFHSQMFFSQKRKLAHGTKVIEVTPDTLVNITLPVPPVEIQCEIVRILDNFTNLTAELTVELTARKKQYDFYRDRLLERKTTKVNFCTVENICEISRGKVISKDFIKENYGEYPVYSSQTENNGVLGWISTFDYDGEYLTWTTDGANAGTVFYRKGRFNITNVCGLLKPKNSEINIRYLYFALKSVAKKYVVQGMGNPKLMSNVMGKIKIPVPPLDVQNRIADVLDNFERICSDLNIGLPAEIEARQKQYEYYRDKLLTFAETGNTILSRAEQSRAEQSRAEQSRAEQSRAEQSTD